MPNVLCRVRPGKQLPHDAKVLEEGTDVLLPLEIAHEVRHLVDEVVGDSVRPLGVASTLEADLAAARPHERISILEAQEAQLKELLAGVQRSLAAERKAVKQETAKPDPKKDDKPADAAEGPKK
jgi:hypothetical protein